MKFEQSQLDALSEQLDQLDQLESEKDELEQNAEALAAELDKISAAKLVDAAKNLSEVLKEEQKAASDIDIIVPPSRPIPNQVIVGDSSASSDAATDVEDSLDTGSNSSMFLTGGLSAASDTGIFGDGITSLSQPTFEGKTLPNLTVQLTVAGTVYSFQSSKSSGEWTFQIPTPIKNGEYEFVLMAKSSDVTEEIKNTITVDATQPNLTNVNWQNDKASAPNIVNNTTPLISGTSIANAIVTLEVAGQKLSTTVGEDGAWNILLTTPLPEGEHPYTLTAETTAGKKETVNANLTVDTRVANSSFSLKEEDDTGEKGDFLTRETSPTFIGTTEAGSKINFNIDGGVLSTTADDDGQWSIQTATLADATYPILIQIIDKAGNELEQSGNVKIQSQLTNNSAMLAATSDTGSSDTDNITKDVRPNLVGTTEPNTSIELTIFGETHALKADASGKWTFDFPSDAADLTAQVYDYTVKATDVVGNENTFNGSFTVSTSVELTAQLAQISTSDPSTPTQTDQPRPTFSGQTAPNATVTFSIGGDTFNADVDASGNWSYRLTTNVTPATYNYVVKAVDLAGNEETVSRSFTYLPNGVALPSVSIQLTDATDSGVKGDGVTSFRTPAFQGAVSAGNSVEFEIGETKINGITVASDGTFTVTLPASVVLNEGVNKYIVKVTEPSTKLQSTLEGTVLVDTTDPLITAKLDTNTGALNDFETQTRTNTLSGTVEIGSTLKLTLDGQSFDVTVDNKGDWTYSSTRAFYDGSYPFTLTAVDVAGNTGTYTNVLVIDNTAPNPTLVFTSKSPFSGNLFLSSDLTPTFSYGANLVSTNPKDVSTIAMTNGESLSAVVGNLITFSTPIGTEGVMSMHRFTFQTEDPAGNASRADGANIYFLEQTFETTAGIADKDADLGKNITSNSRPSFSGAFQAVTSGLDTTSDVTFEGTITFDGTSYPLQMTKGTGNVAWTFEYPDSAPAFTRGEQAFSVYIRDNFENEATSEHTFTFSTMNFNLTAETDTGVLGDFVTSDTSPVLFGTLLSSATANILFQGKYTL